MATFDHFPCMATFGRVGNEASSPFICLCQLFFHKLFLVFILKVGFASSLSFFMDAFNQMDNSVQFRNQINSLVFLKKRWGRRGGNNLNVEINSSAISWFCKFSQFLSSLWRWFPVGGHHKCIQILSSVICGHHQKILLPLSN